MGKHAASETWTERINRLMYELKNPRQQRGAHLDSIQGLDIK